MKKELREGNQMKVGNFIKLTMVFILAVLIFSFINGSSLAATVLFSDNFEDGNYTGWSKNGGSWSVVSDGTKVFKQSSTSATCYAYAGDSSWNNYSVEAKIKALSFNGADTTVALAARFQTTSNFYFAKISNANTISIQKKSGGSISVLASKSYPISTGTFYVLKLEVNGSSLSLSVNGNPELTATDSTFATGKIGFTMVNASGEIDDVVVSSDIVTVTPTPMPTPTPTATPTATPTPGNTPAAIPTPTSESTTTPIPTVTPTSTPSTTPTPTTTIPVNYNIVVAQDGSGDFTTIQAAIDSIPANNDSWATITVKNGTYNEHVFIAKSYIALIGENRENTKIQLALDRAAWNSAMGVTNTGSGVIDIGCTAPDPSTKKMTKVDTTDVMIGNLTVENTATVGSSTVYTHAVRGESTATRISIVSCNVLGMGSDPLALWNTTTGMYYHSNCTFKGKIDAVCPRGWCYDVGSTYIEVGNSAPIWHEGVVGSGQKFVIRNAYVMSDTPKNFKLLNGQKESTVYLLDSYFYNSDGKTITEGSVYAAYYYNCHMEGGDQSWHADNLASAPGSPTQSQVTAKWTFNDQWDPENTLPAVLPYASVPQPWNKANDVSNTAQLKWIKAKDAYSYNIYFGTTSNPSYVGYTTGNTYNPGQLIKGATYYWRIDVVTSNGVLTGPVWSFTVGN